MNNKSRLFIIILISTGLIITSGLSSIAIAQVAKPQISSAGDEASNITITGAGSINFSSVGNGLPEDYAPAAPVPGGPGFVSLSAFPFKPYTASTSYAYIGQYLYNPDGDNGTYNADIQIPDHASVNKFVMYYVDIGPLNPQATLYRCPVDTYSCFEMATVLAEGDLTGVRAVETVTIIDPVIDRQNFTYVVQVDLSPTYDYGLVGVRVDFSYPTQLPLIQK